MTFYRITGLIIGIKTEDQYVLNRMKEFQSLNETETDMYIEINVVEAIETPVGNVILEGVPTLFSKPMNAGFVSCVYDSKSNDVIIMKMDASARWDHVLIEINRNYYKEDATLQECEYQYPFAFCGIAFRNMLMHHNGIVIHSSSLAFRGGGYVFMAPPETGKSTHVKLWKDKYPDEVIIVNDDTPAVRFLDGKLFLFGTPWAGSSEIYSNFEVPLKAIFILDQYHENIVENLSLLESLPVILQQSFLPSFDELTLAKSYDVIVDMLQVVKVFHLRCLANEEAVETVYQCIQELE